ncbi:diaminopimelate decarboxylase [Tepidibacter formicigenes]|jgi:diaminopimelate decarboxylase|uniref:Diaminopimelate decarboxylase n=1 Tax=Tepidibacter formicigenes DSM 15518 TaxID=1123349 RepID=A0A1M6J823_9FIRM|nr:diaminopimelate decarboxylase [Tepidibacter formicigenes]SHJ42840.1 diaminopimelate decarboxylase [Tepidibacter formicigenes DSM 15518]
MRLFETMNINNLGNLEIGNCDTVELAKEFGTPLYVVDEELVRYNCKLFKDSFKIEDIDTEVIYASKAFLNLAMCKIIEEEGLSLDVVSGGELYTALKANFPSNRIYMHGNNKTQDELILAIESGVGRIVVDNRQELELVEYLCEELGEEVNVLLRVNPGIDAYTHEYIQTSKNDSKFGESIYSRDIFWIIDRFQRSNRLNLKGFHCHIGSQIFEEKSFYSSILVMLEFVSKIERKCNFITEELNIGGGFGVRYTEEDNTIDLKTCLKKMILLIKETTSNMNIKTPKIMIEPGRAIIANAGITLYEIGGTKNTYGGKHYIFVDGGMTDNPRTALYGAKYEAVVANKINLENSQIYTVAGKCCESGDIIIKDIQLPKVEKNDILAVFSTGAYNYSMSSNYNRIPRPAVVFVRDGEARLAVRRETYEDIIKNDILF